MSEAAGKHIWELLLCNGQYSLMILTITRWGRNKRTRLDGYSGLGDQIAVMLIHRVRPVVFHKTCLDKARHLNDCKTVLIHLTSRKATDKTTAARMVHVHANVR